MIAGRYKRSCAISLPPCKNLSPRRHHERANRDIHDPRPDRQKRDEHIAALTEIMLRLPDHISQRVYRTGDGRTRVIYRIRFTDWKSVARFFPGTDNLKIALQVRDFRLGQNAVHYDFDQEKQERHVPSQTFFSWSERWLAVKREKRSHDKDRVSGARLKEFFGDVPLVEITKMRVEEYKQWRKQQVTRYGRPPAPGTINRELAYLRSLLIAAAEEGLIAKRPAVELYPEFAKRDRQASAAEYSALLRLIGPAHRIPLIILRELGMRLKEAVCVRWGQISLQQQTIHLGQTKTGEPRLVPMSPDVYRELTVLAAGLMADPQLDDPVFRNEAGKPLTRDMFIGAFKRACKEAGIEGLWRHDLRRTFSTSKLREGWDREFVKKVMGLRSDAALQHYNRPTLEDARRVVGWTAVGPQINAEMETESKKDVSN